MTEKPWYSEGLRFKCTQCGKCCTGAPGYAWVTEKEIQCIAKHLHLSPNEFGRKYLRRVGERWALLENSKNYDCVFLIENRCSIYEVRPTQCRAFPWWPENLSSPEAWENLKPYCEGVNDEAPKVTFEEIRRQLQELSF